MAGAALCIPPHTAEPLQVGAAADLVRAFPELGALFQKRTGIPVQFIFTGSGTLVRQVQKGAPYHVVAVASERYALDLERDGAALSHSTRVFAIGIVVVWTTRHDLSLRHLNDLRSAAVGKIAVANPQTAPYGTAAKQAMERAGLWAELETRIVYGENVGVVQRYVETGQVDAGFISLSQALGSGRHLRVPTHLYDPLRQAVCIPSGSGRPNEARRFCAMLTGSEARAVLKRQGFALPPMPKV